MSQLAQRFQAVSSTINLFQQFLLIMHDLATVQEGHATYDSMPTSDNELTTIFPEKLVSHLAESGSLIQGYVTSLVM